MRLFCLVGPLLDLLDEDADCDVAALGLRRYIN